ncbi:MAG: Crp/Fnr family transcriptional regulator, partial [Cyclobacteriaceae bacterium]|nr:Crp/Fnr family transcriptional regulator [Cyclobacteriaceae bacterium]
NLAIAEYSRMTDLYDSIPNLERFARKLVEQIFVSKERREIEIVMLSAAERYELFKKKFPELEKSIPQYHIASYLGISPTQLSRIRGNY